MLGGRLIGPAAVCVRGSISFLEPQSQFLIDCAADGPVVVVPPITTDTGILGAMGEGLFYHQALRALTEHGVRFVVVGGVAVNLQGVPRFTADLDVALALDGNNLEAAARALLGIGLVPRIPVQPEQLADIATVRTWISERNLRALTYQDPENPLRQVDLLVEAAVPYEEIQRGAEAMDAGDLEIRVASVDVLIRMKTGTGRAQDASDVDALRRVQELDE